MVVLDGFSSFLDVLFLASGLLGIALAYGYLKRMGIERGEYYALLLFSVTGHDADGPGRRPDRRLPGAGTALHPALRAGGFCPPAPGFGGSRAQVFPAGRFATGFVVYGIALVFGATGTTQLTAIVSAVAGTGSGPAVSLPLLASARR